MLRSFSKLPEMHKGLIYMVGGVVALLYALGFFTKGITWLIVIFAIYAILKGLMKCGVYDKIVHAMNRR